MTPSEEGRDLVEMHMSNKALTWAFKLPIKGARKCVLLALAGLLNDKTGQLDPPMRRIALFAGTTEEGARKALRQLETDGLVRTVHATGHRSRYVLIRGEAGHV